MDVKAVLAKLKKGTQFEDLTDEERTAVASLDIDAITAEWTEKLTNAVNRADRHKGDAADLKTKLDALQKQVDEAAAAGMSDTEKLQKQVELLSTQVEAAAQSLEAEKQSHAKTQREHGLDVIHRQMRFDDSVVNGTQQRQLLSAAMADVDLSNEVLVKAAVDEFRKASPGLILADGGGGGAGTRKTVAGGGESTFTRSQIEAMSPAEYAGQKDAIQQAMMADTIVDE